MKSFSRADGLSIANMVLIIFVLTRTKCVSTVSKKKKKCVSTVSRKGHLLSLSCEKLKIQKKGERKKEKEKPLTLSIEWNSAKMGTNLKRSKDGFTDIYKREMGLFRPRNAARRFSASEVSILFSLFVILWISQLS